MGVEQRKASTTQVQGVLGGTAIKPPERKGMEAIRYLIHDPDKGEYFTRTPKSWGLITLFYCIYYTCLAGFWYGLLSLFLMTISPTQPYFKTTESIIGTNPGVGMRPGQPDEYIDSSLIRLKYNAKQERPSADGETLRNIDWAERMKKFVEKYKNTTELRTNCPDGEFNTDFEACAFDPATLGDCGTYPYGYQLADGKKQVEPCILLKINRIFDWTPESYELQYLEDEEEAVPTNVQTLIKASGGNTKLFIDCGGRNPADVEALESAIEYFPKDQSIDFKYFPYTQAGMNYHSPVVAVKFNENIPKDQLVHVECKLWTKNIEHSSKDKLGMIQFELLITDEIIAE